MALKNKAVHECDFCKKETYQVWRHYFDTGSTQLRSHEYNNHTFELCGDCEKKSSNRGFVAEGLMKVLGIKL